MWECLSSLLDAPWHLYPTNDLHSTLNCPPTLFTATKTHSYDFKEVCQWFAERCDLILLLFDAHKLDISDEFQSTLDRLKGQEDKIR